MKTKWSFTAFAIFFTLASCELEVKLSKGKIKGQILKSRNGRPYYSYTGIPYAKPPVNELRFKVIYTYETEINLQKPYASKININFSANWLKRQFLKLKSYDDYRKPLL